MEHLVAAVGIGPRHSLAQAPGAVLFEGDPLLFLALEAVAGAAAEAATTIGPDFIRPDLAESNARHAFGRMPNRPDAVARRRKTGQRTVRENVEQLCDPAASSNTARLPSPPRRRRRTVEDLIANTPGDGIVTGPRYRQREGFRRGQGALRRDGL